MNRTYTVFDEVQETLRRRGWVKGRISNYQGNVCLSGAILEVCGADLRDIPPALINEGEAREVASAVAAALFEGVQLAHFDAWYDGLILNHPWYVISSYNDSFTTTREDVDALLDLVGGKYDGQGQG